MIGTTMLATLPKIIAPFKPLPWQIPAWRDKSPIVLATGTAGGGKSSVWAEKMHAYLKKYPGAFGLMLRKTRQSMVNSTVLMYESEIVGDDPQVRHIGSKYRFEYDNGSMAAYGGMADKEQREHIRSIGRKGAVDIIWIEEATSFLEQDLNELLPRLRGTAAPWQQLMMSCNPDSPFHWINTRMILGGEASVHYSSYHDNPTLPPGYIANMDKLTGVQRLRLRDGKWVQAEGVVYDGFDSSIHVIDPFEIPSDWTRIRAIDFGYQNPFVCQWIAIDHDERMYLYREIYHSRRLVEDHAKQIVELSKGESFEVSVADHDAEDRATLERHGVITRPAEKEIRPGIQGITERLRVAPDGKPRLYVFRNALVEFDELLEKERQPTSTEQEFTLYVWGKTGDGKVLKEVPQDQYNHGMDALRYAERYVSSRRRYGGIFV